MDITLDDPNDFNVGTIINLSVDTRHTIRTIEGDVLISIKDPCSYQFFVSLDDSHSSKKWDFYKIIYTNYNKDQSWK